MQDKTLAKDLWQLVKDWELTGSQERRGWVFGEVSIYKRLKGLALGWGEREKKLHLGFGKSKKLGIVSRGRLYCSRWT